MKYLYSEELHFILKFIIKFSIQ
eukprot:SAG31_NODE_26311_length_444_cov_1.191304_1_plen_22_part_01